MSCGKAEKTEDVHKSHSKLVRVASLHVIRSDGAEVEIAGVGFQISRWCLPSFCRLRVGGQREVKRPSDAFGRGGVRGGKGNVRKGAAKAWGRDGSLLSV